MEEFLKLMAEYTSYTIIYSNQTTTLPSYPFITFTSISKDETGLNYLSSELTDDTLDITETLYKNVQETIQVDFYEDNLSNCRSLATDFVNAVDFKYRQVLNDANIGVIEIGDILDNTRIEQVKSLYRMTCDITIDYTEEVDRTIENLQSVSYTATDEEDNEELSHTVERE